MSWYTTQLGLAMPASTLNDERDMMRTEALIRCAHTTGALTSSRCTVAPARRYALHRAKRGRERFGRVDASEAVRQPVAEKKRDRLRSGERVREEPRAFCLADAGALAEHVARRARQKAATVIPAALRRVRRNRHRLQGDGASAVLQLRVEERRRSRVSGEIARGAEWQ